MFTRIFASCSCVSACIPLAISIRMRTSLTAFSESLSTGVVKPTWSLCAPMATYSWRSAGSLPGMIATTLRAKSLGSST